VNNCDSWVQQSMITRIYELAAKVFAESLGEKKPLCFAYWDLLVADINDAIYLVAMPLKVV